MQSFQVNIKEYLFQKLKQINLLSQKRASTSLLWKHFSKTLTCSQQNGLVFSRLDFSLLHWLWAHHIQVSAQIFYPECRLFYLFQNVSPPQKVLYPKYPLCKPHANNLIKITLPSQEIIQVGSNKTNKFRKPQQGRREQQYALAFLIVTKLSGFEWKCKTAFKEAYLYNIGQSGQAVSIPWIFNLYSRTKSFNRYLAAAIYLILTKSSKFSLICRLLCSNSIVKNIL